jgi:hypothetical protein
MALDPTSIVILSPIVGIIGIALGVYVYKQSPSFPTSKAFLLSMSLFLVGALLDFALPIAPDYQTALWLARALLFVVVLLFASILYLASFLPYEHYSGWFRDREPMLAIIAVFSATIAVLPVDDVVHDPRGWNVNGSLAFLIWTGIVMTYIIVTIFMIHHTCKNVKWDRIRKQSRLLSISVSTPALYAFLTQGLYLIGIETPTIVSPGFLLLALVLAYAILRYRLFLPPIAKETSIRGNGKLNRELSPEENFLLIEEKRPVASYHLFTSLLANGRAGLVITRSYPDVVREEHKLEKTPVLWLAKQPGPDRIEPSNLFIIRQIVSEYLRRGEKAAVIIDSLEYLLENNPPDKVMKMLYDLRDEIVMTDSALILSVDPLTLKSKHMARLEREFALVTA